MTAPQSAPDPEAEALRSRIAALESLARDLLGAYRPYPRDRSPETCGYWLPAVPVSSGEMARMRAVLEGEEG